MVDLFLWFSKFVAPVHFLSTLLCGIIAITINSGFPGRYLFGFLPLLRFVFKQSISPFSFLWHSRKSLILSDMLYIFRHSFIQVYGTISWMILLSIHAITRIFRLVLASLQICWPICYRSFVSLVFQRHPFSSFGKILTYMTEYLISSLMYAVNIFHVIRKQVIGL